MHGSVDIISSTAVPDANRYLGIVPMSAMMALVVMEWIVSAASLETVALSTPIVAMTQISVARVASRNLALTGSVLWLLRLRILLLFEVY